MAEERKEVSLGANARDIVTGFTGIVIGRCEYAYEPPSIAIEALVDGTPKIVWFAASRVYPA